MLSEHRIETGVAKAVRHFWDTRSGQARKQQDAGRSDQGARGAVTGGKQMDGFVLLVRDIIKDGGLSDDCIYTSASLELPGYFRPEKKWDLIVVDDDVLVAGVVCGSREKPTDVRGMRGIVGATPKLGLRTINGTVVGGWVRSD